MIENITPKRTKKLLIGMGTLGKSSATLRETTCVTYFVCLFVCFCVFCVFLCVVFFVVFFYFILFFFFFFFFFFCTSSRLKIWVYYKRKDFFLIGSKFSAVGHFLRRQNQVDTVISLEKISVTLKIRTSVWYHIF